MELINVTNLGKSFGTTEAVKGLNFQIGEGRCVSLLGPNGAGKTTTLKMLAGLLEPTKGTIYFKGKKEKDLRKFIGYLPQYPSFFEWMSGKEFLVFVGQLANLSQKEARIRSDELLERVGLKEAKTKRISGYSGGMKQRLGIAQALIHRPPLLILDEPVSALDPVGRREVLDMMRELKEETTILFSTHVLHDAEVVSDDIIMMHQGNIAISGSLESIMETYRQPMIQIELEIEITNWVKSIEGYPFIKEVTYQGKKVTIVLTDLVKGKEILLRDLVEKKIPIVKFEVVQTTLEDLFMRAVKS